MKKNPPICDCTIYPFEQKCVDPCSGQIIHFAKSIELVTYFNFPEELAEKVYEIAANPNLTNLSDFAPYLNSEEMNQVVSIFSKIDVKGQTWLKTELKKRLTMLEEIPEEVFA